MLMTVRDVVHSGLALWDTGLAPHYDVVLGDGSDFDGLIERLLAVPHEIVDNQAYDPEGGNQ